MSDVFFCKDCDYFKPYHFDEDYGECLVSKIDNINFINSITLSFRRVGDCTMFLERKQSSENEKHEENIFY